jgi:hypothetical protein
LLGPPAIHIYIYIYTDIYIYIYIWIDNLWVAYTSRWVY